jgi:antibiotic biosynthesis monooxygenase (ABM) superfamily enzyme
MPPPTEDSSVTVIVRRRTKPGCETDFEGVMREFVAFALACPGNRGLHVLRSEQGNPREYTVVDRFADAAARKAFTASAPYKEWMTRLRALTEEEPHIEQMGGTSGWFTLPGKPHATPPPRWKMALVTFLGVYPLTATFPRFFKYLLPEWHPLLVNVIVTGLIVASLTWIVMPALIPVFRRWLFPAA